MTVAAVYARKSTDQVGVADQEKSVARQIEHARQYAESKGCVVDDAHVYVDDGISGAEFANRPGFLRLMNALKPRPAFQVLVMSEESRLGREQIETSYALKQIVQAGVRVFFYLEDRERTLDSPNDKIMLSLAAFADELEREKARQRTTDALTRKAQKGYVTGGRCFGYRNREVSGPDGIRSHVEREIIEEEAEVVRRIFQLCVDGLGHRKIAHTLNDEGALCPRPRKDRPAGWCPSSIRSVLLRDAYRGVMTWNKTKKRDSWGQKKSTARPEEEWIQVEVPELRIVDEELWNAAHKRIAATRETYLRHQDGRLWGRPPSGVAGKYLLTGQAVCGICGGGLEVRSRSHGRKRAYFYSCASHYRKGKAICPNRWEMPMPAADEAVLDAVLDDILTPERLVEVTRQAVEMARQEVEQDSGERERIDGQLRDTEQALERLCVAIEAGGEAEALVSRINALETKRETLAARLEALNRPAPEIGPDVEERIAQAAEEWRDVLGRQVPLARQILGKLLQEKVVFKPEDRDGRRGFRFEAVGTIEPLLEGAVPEGLQCMAALTGFEPVSPP